MKNKKNIIWNMIGASSNAFVSLLLMMIVTRINGLNQAGIFTYAFATACLFYVIGVYSGRIYQVTENDEQYSDTDYLYHRITTCVFMMIVTFIFLAIKQYHIEKTMIIFLLCAYRGLDAFFESTYAFMQKNEDLYKVGISMTAKAVLNIIVFLLIDYYSHSIGFSVVAMIITNIVIFICYDLIHIKKYDIRKTKYIFEKNKKLLLLGFFTFAFTFLSLYVINASRYAIDNLLSEDIQAIFGMIIMPATVMSLFSQFIIQPYIVQLKEMLASDNINNFTKTIKKYFLL